MIIRNEDLVVHNHFELTVGQKVIKYDLLVYEIGSRDSAYQFKRRRKQ